MHFSNEYSGVKILVPKCPHCLNEDNDHIFVAIAALIWWRRSAPRHLQKVNSVQRKNNPNLTSGLYTPRDKPSRCPWSLFMEQWVGSLLSTQPVGEDNASLCPRGQKRCHTVLSDNLPLSHLDWVHHGGSQDLHNKTIFEWLLLIGWPDPFNFIGTLIWDMPNKLYIV